MIILIWVHLVAAVAWIGGMLFLSLVLVPILKREGFAGERRSLFQASAQRFRIIVWTSIATLLITGPILMTTSSQYLAGESGWPVVFKVKLSLVAILLGLTALHDFWLGPRILRERAASGQTSENIPPLARLSPWIARLALLLSLVILYLGITIART